jgi:hypothetical protein
MFVFVSVTGSHGLLRHLVHDLIYIKINKMAAFFPISLVHIVGLRGISLSLFTVIPHSEIAGTKPPYVCPRYFIHTYSNKMINRFHV